MDGLRGTPEAVTTTHRDPHVLPMATREARCRCQGPRVIRSVVTAIHAVVDLRWARMGDRAVVERRWDLTEDRVVADLRWDRMVGHGAEALRATARREVEGRCLDLRITAAEVVAALVAEVVAVLPATAAVVVVAGSTPAVDTAEAAGDRK